MKGSRKTAFRESARYYRKQGQEARRGSGPGPMEAQRRPYTMAPEMRARRRRSVSFRNLRVDFDLETGFRRGSQLAVNTFGG